MKDKLKLLLRWAVTFVICFLIIYLIMFFVGWKLFEGGEPILIEIGVALVLSVFVFLFIEIAIRLEKRIKLLGEHIKELEGRIGDK